MDFARFRALYLGAHFGTFPDTYLKQLVKSVDNMHLGTIHEKELTRDPPEPQKVMFYLNNTQMSTNPTYQSKVTIMSSAWGNFW